jgi:predicted Fe-Mo cluster-binding NifX family protein
MFPVSYGTCNVWHHSCFAESDNIVHRKTVMKVLLALNGTRVAPRFAFATDFLLVEFKAKQEVDRKKPSFNVANPEAIAEQVAREGVDLVLTGGINVEYQRQFRLRNIGVIWGLIGEAEDVLAAYLRGKLFAGMGPCPPVKKRTTAAKKE